MKRLYPMRLPLLLIGMIAVTAHAEQPPANLLPGTAITSSRPSVIEGLTEIVAGENVLYVDATGRYLVIGSIYDLAEDKDLSALRRAEVKQSMLEESVATDLRLDRLPLDAGLIIGSGLKSLTVITDPACGWCRRLWAESLRDLKGVTVHHLLAQASEQTIGILCASNPPEALARALEVAVITHKTPVPTAACRRQATEKIARVARFIERSELYGTPVLIREDGAVHRGYLSRRALRAWLEGDHDDAA